MALVFTDWQNATDGETSREYVLDWTDMESVRGKLKWPIFEAIRQATAERYLSKFGGWDELTLSVPLTGETETSVVVTTTIPTDTPSSGYIYIQTDSGAHNTVLYTSYTGSTFTINTTDFRADEAAAANSVYSSRLFIPSKHGDSIRNLANLVDGALGATADDPQPWVTGGWLEYEYALGDWTNVAPTPSTGSYIGEHIPYYTQRGRFLAGFADYLGEFLIVNGNDSARWCLQRYKILNLMQYRGYSDGNTGIGNGGGYPGRTGFRNIQAASKTAGGETWSEATSEFSSEDFSAWGTPYNQFSSTGRHYAKYTDNDPDPDSYSVSRVATRNKLNNFPTNLAKQITWYQIFGPYGTYNNNDYPAALGQGLFYPVWEGPIDEESATDWIELGYDDNATVSTPTTSGVYKGYQTYGGDFQRWGNGFIVLNWGVEAGFTFKAPEEEE